MSSRASRSRECTVFAGIRELANFRAGIALEIVQHDDFAPVVVEAREHAPQQVALGVRGGVDDDCKSWLGSSRCLRRMPAATRRATPNSQGRIGRAKSMSSSGDAR